MSSILKVDTLQDVNGNAIISSDGSGNLTPNTFTALTVSGDLTVDTNTLYVDSANNRVGVGTATPATTLDVNGSIYASSVIRNTGGGSAASPSIQPGNDGDTGMFWAASNTVGFSTTGSERMRIDSSGNVGIGTTSPSLKLEINSGTGNVPLGLTSTDAACYISLRDDTTGGAHGNATVALGAIGDELVLRSNQAEHMRIDSSGNVGIGTSSPATKLHVVGTFICGSGGGVEINGQTIGSGDLDNFKVSGFYRADAAVSNVPSAHIYAVVIFGNGTNVVTQIATRLANTITYVRSFNTSWTSWVRLD